MIQLPILIMYNDISITYNIFIALRHIKTEYELDYNIQSTTVVNICNHAGVQ
jgi:hypothetical protein